MRKKILFAVIAVVAGVVAAADMKLMEAMESGDMKTAVALAKKTLANNPNDYEANLAMALHYEEQENYAEQVKCLNKCLKIQRRLQPSTRCSCLWRRRRSRTGSHRMSVSRAAAKAAPESTGGRVARSSRRLPLTMGSPCGGTASHGISSSRRRQRTKSPSGSLPIPST